MSAFIQKVLSPASGNVVVDPAVSTDWVITYRASVGVAIAKGPANQVSELRLLLIDDGGNRAPTWPSTVHFSSGSAPALTTAGVFVHLFSFDGINWYQS